MLNPDDLVNLLHEARSRLASDRSDWEHFKIRPQHTEELIRLARELGFEGTDAEAMSALEKIIDSKNPDDILENLVIEANAVTDAQPQLEK